MPVPFAAKAGVVAISVAVAAAIAVYESPELRRMAEDIRRRIAIALHSLGDNIDPSFHEPAFNRPKDVEGFLMSRGTGNEMDADNETRRRQREELMFWNAVHEEKHKNTGTGTGFHDLANQGLVRRHGHSLDNNQSAHAVRSIAFGDEQTVPDKLALLALGHEDGPILEDIYNATSPSVSLRTTSPVISSFDDHDYSRIRADKSNKSRAKGLVRGEQISTDQEGQVQTGLPGNAFASIQAWAEISNPGICSEVLDIPATPVSEPELVSHDFVASSNPGSMGISSKNSEFDGEEDDQLYELTSDEEDAAIQTPTSWTEVGSVVSENENAI